MGNCFSGSQASGASTAGGEGAVPADTRVHPRLGGVMGNQIIEFSAAVARMVESAMASWPIQGAAHDAMGVQVPVSERWVAHGSPQPMEG